MATTSSALLACRTCGFASPPGTPTCPYCGVDPAYVAPVIRSEVDAWGRPRVAFERRDLLASTAFGIGVGLLLFGTFSDAIGLSPFGLLSDRTMQGLRLLIAVAGVVLVNVAAGTVVRRYRPRRQTTGTLRQAEERLDAALADARTRRARLDALHAHAPASTDHGLATRTLADAARVLDARIGALERARFDLRLVWWKNRVDLALARHADGAATAHDTFTALAALRAEATTALATLGPDRAYAYADVRPRLAAANDALGAYTARVYDASVAEAVAGIAAPLSEASVVRAEVDAALDRLAVLAEAAPAAARADALTRESARIALEADDLDPADDRTASGDAWDVGRRRVRP